MESNRDEAQRCIELAERCILEKNRAEAEKFLRKAQSLYPTEKARELINQTRKLKWESSSAPSLREKLISTEQFKRKTRGCPKHENRTMEKAVDRIMEETIGRIIMSKNYYEMLQVNRDSSDRDIKRAFKKLALLIHPDKNKLPGSEEAFKLIRKAVATLTDSTQRKAYDKYDLVRSRYKRNRGDYYQSYYETLRRTGSSTDSTNYDSSSSIEDESESEPQGSPVRQVYSQNYYVYDPVNIEDPSAQDGPTFRRIIIQVLPILLALVLWYFSSLMIPDPLYKFQPTTEYTLRRFTQRLKIPYYIKANFLNEKNNYIKEKLETLENNIENEVVRELEYACYSEKNYRKCFSLLYYNIYYLYTNKAV